MNRRQLLKAGMVGGILLAAGGAWIAWRDLRAADDGDPARDRIASIVGALAPVILAGMLPSDSAERSAGIARVVAGVRSVILEFPDAVQQEIADLFRTLDIRFAVTDRVRQVPVHYVGILPDMFKEGTSIIATGTMHDNEFDAEQVLAKHDETYMPKEVAEAMAKGIAMHTHSCGAN